LVQGRVDSDPGLDEPLNLDSARRKSFKPPDAKPVVQPRQLPLGRHEKTAIKKAEHNESTGRRVLSAIGWTEIPEHAIRGTGVRAFALGGDDERLTR
jgi:hypothetical protein